MESSSSDTDDIDEDPAVRPIKRYKRYLDADFKEHEVTAQTFKKWESSFLKNQNAEPSKL